MIKMYLIWKFHLRFVNQGIHTVSIKEKYPIRIAKKSSGSLAIHRRKNCLFLEAVRGRYDDFKSMRYDRGLDRGHTWGGRWTPKLVILCYSLTDFIVSKEFMIISRVVQSLLKCFFLSYFTTLDFSFIRRKNSYIRCCWKFSRGTRYQKLHQCRRLFVVFVKWNSHFGNTEWKNTTNRTVLQFETFKMLFWFGGVILILFFKSSSEEFFTKWIFFYSFSH